MPRRSGSYPLEFRTNAVKLLRSSGRSIADVARDLGCSDESLRQWAMQATLAAAGRHGLSTDERAELVRLRRENKILIEEREILRKAAAFFAGETGRTR